MSNNPAQKCLRRNTAETKMAPQKQKNKSHRRNTRRNKNAAAETHPQKQKWHRRNNRRNESAVNYSNKHSNKITWCENGEKRCKTGLKTIPWFLVDVKSMPRHCHLILDLGSACHDDVEGALQKLPQVEIQDPGPNGCVFGCDPASIWHQKWWSPQGLESIGNGIKQKIK